jgi:hypothetical protein
VLEADYGIAQSLKEQGKLDDAVNLLTGLIRAPTATAELRASGMLLGGSIMAEKAKAATDQQQKDEYLGAAIDYFIKIAQFYSGVPTVAAEVFGWAGNCANSKPTVRAMQNSKRNNSEKPKLPISNCSKITRIANLPQRPRSALPHSAGNDQGRSEKLDCLIDDGCPLRQKSCGRCLWSMWTRAARLR